MKKWNGQVPPLTLMPQLLRYKTHARSSWALFKIILFLEGMMNYVWVINLWMQLNMQNPESLMPPNLMDLQYLELT